MFSSSLCARGSKTRETPSQQPLHAIPTGSLLLRYGGFAAKNGADARLLAGMSDLGLHHELAKVGTVRGCGRYPITCENVRAPVPGIEQRRRSSLSANPSRECSDHVGRIAAPTARNHFTARRSRWLPGEKVATFRYWLTRTETREILPLTAGATRSCPFPLAGGVRCLLS